MSAMKIRGWNSNDQLSKARKELLEKGWIVLTKQGGLGIGPNLYAVTFQAVDDCGGKLHFPETTTPLGYWKLRVQPGIKSAIPWHGTD